MLASCDISRKKEIRGKLKGKGNAVLKTNRVKVKLRRN